LTVSTLFFFGTLRHPPLLETVMGDAAHLRLTPAQLPGYRVRSVIEGPFPGIEADTEGVADGLRVDGLRDEDLARLDFYEKCFDYTLRDEVLADGAPARVYFPAQGVWHFAGPWSLEAWARDWGELSVISAGEVMSYYGQKSPEEVGVMFPMIRARAAARLNARSSRHGKGTLQGQVEVLDHRRPYARFFALEEYDLRHSRFDGRMSETLLRAVFRATDAALVLPYDPRRDRVLVVEQMRMGPLARGDAQIWQLEPVAGFVDPGETPQQAARREAQEEADLTLGALHPVAENYPSAGNSTEFHYIYVGLADLPERAETVGGLASEGEDIRSHLLSFDDLMALCDDRRLANGPLLIAAYWLARHREGLRAER
jgi:nudix-type nucleoside diphosphatase (YffH/AdpP family)